MESPTQRAYAPHVWELDQRYPDLPGRDQGSRGLEAVVLTSPFDARMAGPYARRKCFEDVPRNGRHSTSLDARAGRAPRATVAIRAPSPTRICACFSAAAISLSASGTHFLAEQIGVATKNLPQARARSC